MLTRGYFILAFIAIATLAARPLKAGECVDGEEAYVSALESTPDSGLFEYAIYCLADNPIVDGRLWAGPRAGAEFARLRADTLNARIERAVLTLLHSSWADSGENRHLLYRILARRGISHLDSIDVFDRLLGSGKPLYCGMYEDMAIMRDCRSVDFLRSRYKQLRHQGKEAYADEVLDLLSCLYHIPCAQAMSATKELYANESDEKLRERLRRVLNRK